MQLQGTCSPQTPGKSAYHYARGIQQEKKLAEVKLMVSKQSCTIQDQIQH